MWPHFHLFLCILCMPAWFPPYVHLHPQSLGASSKFAAITAVVRASAALAAKAGAHPMAVQAAAQESAAKEGLRGTTAAAVAQEAAVEALMRC